MNNSFTNILAESRNLSDYPDECKAEYEEWNMMPFMGEYAVPLSNYSVTDYEEFYDCIYDVNGAITIKLNYLLSQQSDDFIEQFKSYMLGFHTQIGDKINSFGYPWSKRQMNDISRWFLYVYPHDKVDDLDDVLFRSILNNLNSFVYDKHPENQGDAVKDDCQYFRTGKLLETEFDHYGVEFYLNPEDEPMPLTEEEQSDCGAFEDDESLPF